MTTPVIRRRPLLEAGMISRHGAEILPDPLQQLLGLFHAAETRRMQRLQVRDFRVRERVVRAHEPAAHDEDIAELQLRALPFQDLLQPREFYAAALEAREVADAGGVAAGPVLPPCEIDQDAAADDAVFLEVLYAQDVRLGLGALGRPRYVLDGGVVVESLRGLVPEMAEAVPLGGGLCVEVPGVVVDYAGFLLVDVFLEDLTAEEGAVAWW